MLPAFAGLRRALPKRSPEIAGKFAACAWFYFVARPTKRYGRAGEMR